MPENWGGPRRTNDGWLVFDEFGQFIELRDDGALVVPSDVRTIAHFEEAIVALLRATGRYSIMEAPDA